MEIQLTIPYTFMPRLVDHYKHKRGGPTWDRKLKLIGNAVLGVMARLKAACPHRKWGVTYMDNLLPSMRVFGWLSKVFNEKVVCTLGKKFPGGGAKKILKQQKANRASRKIEDLRLNAPQTGWKGKYTILSTWDTGFLSMATSAVARVTECVDRTSRRRAFLDFRAKAKITTAQNYSDEMNKGNKAGKAKGEKNGLALATTPGYTVDNQGLLDV